VERDPIYFRDRFDPDPSWPSYLFAIFVHKFSHFHGNGDEQLTDRAAALPGNVRVIFGSEDDKDLVDLDHSAELAAIWINHGPPELGEHQPSGLIRAKTELLVELQSGYPVGMRIHS